MIKIAVCGAAGRMGQRIINSVIEAEGVKLSGALERPGHPALGQWVGLAWGIFAAFWELYKVNRRMSRRDEAELKRLQEGKGPRE